MGSGREGSPSPVGVKHQLGRVAGKNAVMSPSAQYKLQREELLGGGSSPTVLDPYNAPQKATTMASPRVLIGAADPAKPQLGSQHMLSPRGATPSQTPHNVSPLPSPKGPVPLDPVNSQETVVKAGGEQPISLRRSPAARVLDLSNALQKAKNMVSPRVLIRAADPAKQQLGPQHMLSPRGATPLHSPRTMSPFPSPKGPVPMDPVDFQETVVRAEGEQQFSLGRSPAAEGEEMHDDGPTVGRRSRSDIAEGRQRSPFSSRRFKLEVVPAGKETLALPQNWIPDVLEPAQQRGFPISPDWAVRERRGERIEMVETKEGTDVPDSLLFFKANKSSSRRVRLTEAEETQEGDLGMGHKSRATRRSRSHSGQQKRKASDPVPALTLALPESYPSEQASVQACEANRSSSRRDARGTRSDSERPDWLQFAVDIIMWRHVPRSALLFGMGCFCILSASLMQDLQYSIITVWAYLALVYLAVVFFQHTVVRRTTPQTPTRSFRYEINEADANKVIKLLLPPINIMLTKFSELFCGEPAMTLKVASALWLLAQAGSILSFWTLARLAYFSLFIIPKCYSCYSMQLHGYARNLLMWGWATWATCSHKKAVLFAAFVTAWNFSSVSSRICGAFTFIVAFRVYHHCFRLQQADQNMMKSESNSGVHLAASHSLELIRMPQSMQQSGFRYN